MKIVHIIESTATGTLSICSLMANIQAKYKHNVSVIFSRRKDTPDDVKANFDSSVKLIECNLSIVNAFRSVIRLRRELKEIAPDVVHAHSSIAGFISRMSCLGLDIDILYSPHCISLMRKDIGHVKKFLFRMFECFACIKKSKYIACSRSEQEVIAAALPNVDVVLLENAVVLSDFKYNPIARTIGDELKVITVGGIRPQKGYLEFIRIAKNFKCKNVSFIWVGDGNDTEKKLLNEAGVTVTGWKSKQEVIQELYSADLYLSTARWEGMPVSLIEASAACLPIIANSCLGNVDIIEHKETGYLFNTTSEGIELVEQFIQDRTPYKKCAENAYHVVFERFSVERFSKELIALYKS
ncbi:glycosyltransferase [Vibrio hippocampi]|uniref:Glycosyltransferase n=1 Tax=Vibrio hippocampi TaxID=654686 RepID=A0ABN8DHW5_9VIBR|nr:glycosyltransferase [Vibrio hippocampi]CAH0527270.1 hypothetical protein VHP8226_02598 [Vibrio hippocampi]